MKRQKHPRLPNGYGSIKYMGKGRSRPYRVCAPSRVEKGKIIPGETLCYVDDWYKGYAVLTRYKAGEWLPGMSTDIFPQDDPEGLKQAVERLIDDYRAFTGRRVRVRAATFQEVAEKWYADKYERPDLREFSESTKANIRKGLRKLEVLNPLPFEALRLDDLQSAIDRIDTPTMQDQARGVLHGLYEYAVQREIVQKDYSAAIRVASHSRKHGEPFTPEEIRFLWEHQEEPEAEMLLIMIFSGFRISAYKDMKIDLKDEYFQGGVKTDAGKDRIVPIHPAIVPLVKRRLKRYGCLIPDKRVNKFGQKLSDWCRANGMEHTPHHTRHTFSALCEKYEVKENDRKRLLGHAFKDITNSVYGHRDLEDLRAEIVKLETQA